MDKLLRAARAAAAWATGSRTMTSSWNIAGSRLTRDHDAERGQGLAEYALILGLIAIVAIVSLVFLGGTISDMFWDPISDDFGEVLKNLGL